MEKITTRRPEFSPGDSYLDSFIEKRHNIEAELSLMKRNGLSDEQVSYYSQESLATLIDEHLLGVAFPRISGRITADGRMELQGIDMTASFMRMREGMQPGSRYWCESEGYLRATELLRSPDVSGVYLSSPKIEGLDRRMSMVLVKDGVPREDGSYGFKQQCITHPDNQDSSKQAQLEFRSIAQLLDVPLPERPLTTAELLKTPIALSEEGLADVYGCLGLSDVDIEASRDLQSLLRSTLHKELEEYSTTMVWACQFLKHSQELPQSLYDDLCKKRRELFRLTLSLFQVNVNPSSFDRTNYDPELCPFLPDRQEYVSTSLRQGFLPSESLNELRYQECEKCPSCGTFNVTAIIYNGYIQCPHCLDKKPYAC